MQSYDFIVTLSALACQLAKDKSVEEIELLSSIFLQLGETLSTIAAKEAVCAAERSE